MTCFDVYFLGYFLFLILCYWLYYYFYLILQLSWLFIERRIQLALCSSTRWKVPPVKGWVSQSTCAQ